MDEGGSREMIDLTKSKAAFEEAKNICPAASTAPCDPIPIWAARLLH